MQNIINDIGSFIFVEDEPRKSDLIIAAGGSFPQIAEKAAELYHGGYAPYIVAGGGFSVKLGRFAGVKDKADIYNRYYPTECDFYTHVLLNNGVPESAVIREDKSGHTRENAEFAKAAAEKMGMSAETLIIVCKRFHARRCQMFFSSVFTGSEILVVPADIPTGDRNITKENWYTTSYGMRRVMGELSRCDSQFDERDIEHWKV